MLYSISFLTLIQQGNGVPLCPKGCVTLRYSLLKHGELGTPKSFSSRNLTHMQIGPTQAPVNQTNVMFI